MKLKPCPFCGGKAKTYPNEVGWWACCAKCGSMMCRVTQKAAVDSWDARPLEDALAEFARHVDKGDVKALTPEAFDAWAKLKDLMGGDE